MSKEHSKTKLSDLHKRALTIQQKKISDMPPDEQFDIKKLIHELTTYQIELELQNEDLRQAQQKLEEYARKYTELYDFAPVGYLSLSNNGLIVEANLTVTEMLGIERSHLLQTPLAVFIHQDDQAIFYSHRKKLLTSQQHETCELRLRKRNGPVFPVRLESRVETKRDGVVSEQLGIVITDISAQKKLEDALLQSQKMEAVGNLAGGIAHDFNNILTAILGYADLAWETIPDDNPAREYAHQVIMAGNRAKELINQILTFSRKGREILQPLNPYPIIKEALKFIRVSLPTTIEIREEIDPQCGAIMADPTNIHQVLINLCINAMHAMQEEKGIVTVGLRRVELKEYEVIHETGVSEGPFIELMVKDTGCGMDKETMQRILEPYFSTRAFGNGSGMGLAMVHGIVQGCKGFIRVQSEPGKGATFLVYFPAVEEEPAVIEREDRQHAHHTKGSERILIVDDEEIIGNMYKTYLEKLGYQVAGNSDPEKALDSVRGAPDSFDLVITDQTMPNLSGAELARELLQISPDIPIILCTGYSSVISEEKAKEIGITKYLIKPVPPMDLAVIIRNILDRNKTPGN